MKIWLSAFGREMNPQAGRLKNMVFTTPARGGVIPARNRYQESARKWRTFCQSGLPCPGKAKQIARMTLPTADFCHPEHDEPVPLLNLSPGRYVLTYWSGWSRWHSDGVRVGLNSWTMAAQLGWQFYKHETDDVYEFLFWLDAGGINWPSPEAMLRGWKAKQAKPAQEFTILNDGFTKLGVYNAAADNASQPVDGELILYLCRLEAN
jgi:hypothetical protein